MPVNMRTGSGCPNMENTFAPPIFNIPTCSSDPLVSCRNMKAAMDDLKSKPVPHVFYFSIRFMAFYTPAFLSKYLLDDLASKTSAVVSNVPGPLENKYFVDKKLERKRIAMWSPQRGTVSFGVTMFTIGNRVNVASVMDTGADDKPQMLCN
ncbi:hypothetical protein SARC_04734 [Sphaeroforma arctica JP610]|uniref:O-acyltransferase WSD1 C-terminal domain-containing protein n=1 Tax=Sphaeroforma arctica JP610 TaxID=667725 RepID=A0A0L0G2D1_9EUKA|nr:hypothetical protein SARC_04734 [Sphaeroforma arctica JP610]KNC82986.1 hypothetical protein SARC_04734 [Sphaeroforma arctica JP610]|eukprot:XP_014156888.1 hypothetical protein SARC_04734 [Sphaeroforma arctica JP610]